ncbi:alpha/beta-hydrolase [Auricularia subglabra TFB-10046 SS5]|nr:alpha/beta-hydrolase [Auricularia subglabra TFB-10046 SS5]
MQIALQMLPATDKENYQGTIIVNPGGPSGPGTQFVLSGGTKLSRMFGPSFDILGFDPRGTGATTPLIQCFDNLAEGNAWRTGLGMMWDRPQDTSVARTRAHMQLLGLLCKDKFGGNGKEEIGANATEWGPARFVGTASVVKDMVRISEKLGQPKLRYYGVSYGTTIGQHLAALFPDKIERMIIDGVQDGYHWLNGYNWDTVRDAGKVIDDFYQTCAAAGASKCPIWEKTARGVEKRMERVLDSLRTDPIAVPHSAIGPFVLTEDIFLQVVFGDLYSPLYGFPDIAQVARAVETRDQARLAALAASAADTSALPPWYQPNESLFAIECGDFPPYTDALRDSTTALRKANALVPRLGLYAASSVTHVRIACSGWPIAQKNRFTGPLAGTLPVPVLVTSSRYDPVTPLAAARNVTARYPGMRLFVHEGAGHAAYTTMSKCTANVMRAYMTTGELPPEGATCARELVPFVDVEDLDYDLAAQARFGGRLFSHPLSRRF